MVIQYVRTIKEKCHIVLPDEKAAIYFFREALDMVWRITNCWRHCDIMPDQSFERQHLQIFMKEISRKF